MLDEPILLPKARSELTRLNGELRELHLEEERCKLKRSRLEGDKARVQTLVDMCELSQRLTGKPLEQAGLLFHVEECHGAKLVVIDKPVVPLPAAVAAKSAQRQKRKPDGLPTVMEMVLAVLEAAEGSMRPRDIAQIAQRKWWPDLPSAAVNAAISKLANSGRLEKDGHHYRLNGVWRTRLHGGPDNDQPCQVGEDE
jgi:hypothetical protein